MAAIRLRGPSMDAAVLSEGAKSSAPVSKGMSKGCVTGLAKLCSSVDWSCCICWTSRARGRRSAKQSSKSPSSRSSMAEDRAFISQTTFDAVSITASGGRLPSVSVSGSGLVCSGVGIMSGVIGVFSALGSVTSDGTSDIVSSGFARSELGERTAPAPTAAGFAEVSGVASSMFARGGVGEVSAPAPTAAGLDDRVGEGGASGSGEETSRRSLAPARIMSSADGEDCVVVLSWASIRARRCCASVSSKDSIGAGLVSGGSVEGMVFRAHGTVFKVGVASCGVRSCVSWISDGGVTGPYKEASVSALTCGDVPHFVGGVRSSFGLLSLRLSRMIVRCWSRVISLQAAGSWPRGISEFESCWDAISLAAMEL